MSIILDRNHNPLVNLGRYYNNTVKCYQSTKHVISVPFPSLFLVKTRYNRLPLITRPYLSGDHCNLSGDHFNRWTAGPAWPLTARDYMMTSWNGNIFRVIGPLCAVKSRTKASDTELDVFFSLICAWINAWVNNREAIGPIMTSL